jgi:hypothetical protein
MRQKTSHSAAAQVIGASLSGTADASGAVLPNPEVQDGRAMSLRILGFVRGCDSIQ